MHSIEEIIVIGSGNWGLALASVFSVHYPIRVWTIDAAMAESLNANRKSPGPFYEYPIPDSVVIEEKYTSSFDQYKALIIIAVPSGQVTAAAKELSKHAKNPLVLSVSKGFDAQRQCTMSDLIKSELPGALVVVLTGPTIANEVAEVKPTRAVLACEDLMTLALVKNSLRNDVLSFEVSRNPTHHEICAALKGIVAIAVGIAEGLDLGCNAQGIIITEGIHELATVASFFGIPHIVAYGTSGAADLIATCISSDSRNVHLGRYLAEGNTVQQALDKVGMAVEGVAMSKTIEMLWALNVSIPLIHMVNTILLDKCLDMRKEFAMLIRRF
jgi:glycerol-3-phosphate dehydrogenase (NAD(P)+)